MKKRQALPLNIIEVFEFPETSSMDPPPTKALDINTWAGNKMAWSSFPTRGHNLTKGEKNLIEGQCRNMHPKILEGLGEQKYSAKNLPLEACRKNTDNNHHRTLSRSPRSSVGESPDENGLAVPKTPELWSRMATARSEVWGRSSSAASSVWDWDSDRETPTRGRSGRFSAMLVPADYPSRRNRPKSVHTPLCPCVKCRQERNPSQASVSDVGSAFDESLSEEPIGNVPGINVVPEISVAPAGTQQNDETETDTKD